MPLSDPRMSSSAITLQGRYSSISDPGTAYFVAPEAGYIKEIHCVLGGTTTGSDNILTLSTVAGAVSTTVSVPAGSAGDVASGEIPRTDANNYVNPEEGFSIATGGEGGGVSIPAELFVVLEVY